MIADMSEPALTLRDVQPQDAAIYVRMRCDPGMMSELGGPRPVDEVLAKAARDVDTARSGAAWILMIVLAGVPEAVGTVVVWENTEHGEPFSEIGWMVLPDHQGQGVARAAVRAVLVRARHERRWGVIHAFPGVTNGPSNGICRSLGFTLLGPELIEFVGQQFQSNHWAIDPSTLPQEWR